MLRMGVIQLGLTALALAAAGVVAAPPSGAADPHCTRRANGRKFEIGEIVCVRGRLSQCRMNQNNPSWQPISDTCPQSRAAPSAPSGSSLGLSFSLQSLPRD